MTSHRSRVTWVTLFGGCVLLAWSALAVAQTRPDLACRKTETQPECHARLKCNADEELEDCQKRLAKEGEKGGADKERAEGRDRDNSGREGGDRRQRDEGGTSRRQRGEGRNGERRRGAGRSTRGFEAIKTFGLGLELGEPTGLNGKVFVSKAGAIDFGVGWIYSHYYYGDGLHVYADYLWHPASLASTSTFELPLYIGAGLRFWDFHYCDQRICDYGGTAIGLRLPVGIAFDFNNVPLDLFFQVVPVVDLVNGDYYNRYGDRAHLGVDLSLGLRFWFK